MSKNIFGSYFGVTQKAWIASKPSGVLTKHDLIGVVIFINYFAIFVFYSNCNILFMIHFNFARILLLDFKFY